MKPSTSALVPPRMLPFELLWTTWLLALIISFGVLEGEAIHKRRSTLSRFVWEITEAWPPFGWLAGIIVGFLGAHFFWTKQGL